MTPTLYKESTSVNITWDEPLRLNNKNTVTNLQYRVVHCLINKPDTCINGTKISTRKYVIDGLERSMIYTYHIYVYTTNGAEGPVAEDVFTTKRRGTNDFYIF